MNPGGIYLVCGMKNLKYEYGGIIFPGGSGVKNLPASAGDLSLIPRSGRSPEEGNGNPLQSSCLENSVGRGAWRAAVHGVAEGQTEQLTHLTSAQ